MGVSLTNVFRRTAEALMQAKKGTGPRLIINQGGQGCFYSDQDVFTIEGHKRISEIKKGDIVLSYNERKRKKEWKKVIHTFAYTNEKKCIEVRMKDGSVIKATDDHKFFFEGKWIQLKQIIEKYELEKNTGFQQI